MSNPRPVLIFDGKCGFCRIWIDYWRKLTGGRVEYVASQEVGDRFPQIPADAYKTSVQLVRPDGSVASGAHAVFESLDKSWLYGYIATPAESCYRFIAGRRDFFYHCTRLLFGATVEPVCFQRTQWLFLRALAIVYAIAFASLATQVLPLYGSGGILPISTFLSEIARGAGAIRFLAVPSIFWIASDDTVLTGMCWVGVLLSVMLMITGFQSGRFERAILAILFVLYLSFSAAGQEFLSFQWDSLLLEAGFLSIFLGRNRIIPWMFRWLTFRLFFLSGAVKLLSGDKTWRNLTALDYHYHTQPLPTPLAWYADQFPQWIQKASTFSVVFIELVIPFLIFLPRRLRIFGAWCLIGFQVLILLSGNYTFFNLLALALCLFLFDDRALRRVKPEPPPYVEAVETVGRGSWSKRIAAVAATVILVLGLARFWLTFAGRVPAPVAAVIRYTAPLQIVNTYGLFAVMTTTRNEIVLEGSADGQEWKEYEFRYKPGSLQRRPRWVAPHQPRLDWQMWFAALGNYQSNPWLVNLVVKLLENSESVTALLESNPFPTQAPKFVRAVVYEYRFTNFAERNRTGAWWKRQPKGQYLPAVGLRSAAQNTGNQ